MFKKILFFILISLFFNNLSYGILGSSSKSVSDSNETTDEPKGPKKSSNYKKAQNSIKKAKKLESKGKIEKAKLKYEKALKFLYQSNADMALQENTLKDMGFVNEKLGNYENAEIYYLLGLELNPEHKTINKLLGQLYIDLNEIKKAKERLKVLENCKCTEFVELNNAIKSK